MCASTREVRSSRPGFLPHCVWAAAIASVALALSACGGGGGGGGDGGGGQATNQPPAVQAGADQTITLPTNSVQLQGSATDDGLPAGAALTYSWSTTGSGVTFSSPSAASTTATFAAAGTYTLTLSASDSAASGSDTVTITVNAAANAAPVVQAGADQTIELPTEAVQLQGSATDDGDAAALTYSWAATPATGVTIDNAAAAATSAHFTTAGAYTLTLTVSDGSLTGTDSVAVTVNPAVYPAADDNTQADHGWTRVAAADVGMNQSLLDQAAAYAQSSPVGAGSGIIVRHGRLVHSWGDIDVRYEMKSTSKSIGGIALGLAIDDGKLTLADIAQTHLPNLGVDPGDPTENVGTGWLDDITVLQLATHTAGFAKPGGYVPLLYQPGTTWSYSDAGLNWLADLLTNVYTQDLNALLNTRVWTVLGIDGAGLSSNDLRWRDNEFRADPRPDGVARRELASGINTNVNTMARVGLLFLRKGVWSNDRRIVSQSFVDTVRVPTPANAALNNADPANFPESTLNYGVLWWTNATSQLPNVPTDAYWAWGLGDSLIVVIPSLDIVVARAGLQNPTVSPGIREWNDQDWNGDYNVLAPLLDPIVQSITQ